MKTAGVMATIDLELMWGFNKSLVEKPWMRHSPTFMRYIMNMARSRRVVNSLLKAVEELDFRLTWAVVGHLALDSCERLSGLPHPDMPRPETPSGLDWYAFDPCSDIEREPLWYGSDIIKTILESPVEHEIACHSFSHVDFSACDRKVAEAEVITCLLTLKERFDVRPVSFVFPFDRVGHLDVLVKHGFKVFRSPTRSLLWPFHRPRRLKGFIMSKLERPLASGLKLPPRLGVPKKVGSLVEVPNTGLLYRPSEHGSKVLLARLSRALSVACDEGLLIHVYAHVHNLAQGRSHLRAFLCFLKMAKAFEKQGLLCILTMRDAYELAV